MNYYEIVSDLVLATDGDKEQIQDDIMDALIEVAEKHGGGLAGSLKLVPTTEEKLEAEVEEVLNERQATTFQ